MGTCQHRHPAPLATVVGFSLMLTCFFLSFFFWGLGLKRFYAFGEMLVN